jgi:hypothetical protein
MQSEAGCDAMFKRTRTEVSPRDALTESSTLIAVAAAGAILIASTPLDTQVGRWLLHATIFEHGPLFYQLAPTITTILMVCGLLAIFAARHYANERWRASGVFLILLVLIGHAVSAWAACGECSAGYCCAAGWWLWRRKHPAWALASLVVGLVFGLWIGLQCVATGRHPFSDTIWSALLIFGLAHLLYYHALRMQLLRRGAQGDSDDSRHLAPPRLPGLRTMLLLLVLALIARVPHEGQPTDRTRVAMSPSPQQPAPEKAQP